MKTDYYINVTQDGSVIFYCAFSANFEESGNEAKAIKVLDGIAKLAHEMFGDAVSVDLYRKVWVNGI